MTNTTDIKPSKYDQYIKGIAFGIINGVMVTPVMISFCTIIFRDVAYDSYLPSLVKLVLFSSLVHQFCFTIFSGLPFAIGQVQDAGLIFLSTMASSVAASCTTDTLLPTALFVLSIGTMMLGVMLIVIGKLRLASVVQYLPMPVVGGYLAYIGFFCGQAGLAMMADVQVSSIADWGVFFDSHAFILMCPGILIGVAMYLLVTTMKSPYTLPVCIVVTLVLFYVFLWLCGATIDDARDYGWISPLSEPVPFYHAWSYYDIYKVNWSVFPKQIITWTGMFFVVAFSSSLDIAAIEMELGLPMDYDRELETVGISNLTSGLLGGYTGSYIFSQTIFTMRRGVNSRVCGLTVVLCELAVLIIPFAITSFVPKLFFGSLLVFISLDLMWEWLVEARHKMMMAEYAVCLFTFGVIQYTGIEIGMLLGIVAAMVSFVVSYANSRSVTVSASKTSRTVRTFEEQAVLAANRGKVVTISLSGFIFFGSAVQLLEEVKKHVVIVSDDKDSESERNDSDMKRGTETARGHGLNESSPLISPHVPPSNYMHTPPRSPLPGSKVASSPSRSECSATSFSVANSLYGLTSEQIMKRHEKWKQFGTKSLSVVDSGMRRAGVNGAAGGDDINGDYYFSDLEEVHTEDHSVPEMLKSPFPSDDDMAVPKQPQQSFLCSIWDSQGPTRSQRERAVKAKKMEQSVSHVKLQGLLSPTGDASPQVPPSDLESSHHLGGDVQETSIRTEYLILNLTDVSGLDATAARSCFLMLAQLLRGAGATVVFACPNEEIERLLRSHGVILENDKVTSQIDDALEWCEEQILYKAHVNSRSSYAREVTNFAFSPRREYPRPPNALINSRAATFIGTGVQADQEYPVRLLNTDSYYRAAYNERHNLSPVKRQGRRGRLRSGSEGCAVDNRQQSPLDSDASPGRHDPQPSVQELASYRVLRRIFLDYLEVDPGSDCPDAVKRLLRSELLAKFFSRKMYSRGDIIHDMDAPADEVFFVESGVVELLLVPEGRGSNSSEEFVRVSKVSVGGVFGDMSFFLTTLYSCRAQAVTDCSIWTLNKKYYAAMECQYPRLCILVQHVLLKSMAMAQANATHSMHPFSTYQLLFK